MELEFAFSPCPNDTFSFAAAVHGWVDTEGLVLRPRMADILELNRMARQGEVPVCKVSFFAYHFLRPQYTLLEAGAALGRGVGPLVVSREPLSKAQLADAQIAIPGRDTTAHLLFEYYAPEAQKREVRLFHEILSAVARGEVDAGVIIHESRFTYPDYGLHWVQDLGVFWEQQTGSPIPLGGIVARTDLGEESLARLNRVLRRSVEFGFRHPEHVQPYVAAHAQEMTEDVQRRHIQLYVTPFSLDLGSEGHRAIETLLLIAARVSALAG